MERVCIVCGEVGLTPEVCKDALVKMGYKVRSNISRYQSKNPNSVVLYGKDYGDVGYSTLEWYKENAPTEYRKLGKDEISAAVNGGK